MFLRIYQCALVKSLEIKTYYEDDFTQYPSLSDMACNRRIRNHRIPFIAVSNNFYGCTTHYNPNLRNEQQKSFGCPRYFFRFNFTSALFDEPYAFVDWVQFTAVSFRRTCFMGFVSNNEWRTGPSSRARVCPFVQVSEIEPSRFLLAYDNEDNVINIDVSFVALDPERLGDLVDHGSVMDFGDNILRYNRKLFSFIVDSLVEDSDESSESDDDDHVINRSDNLISPAMMKFLKS